MSSVVDLQQLLPLHALGALDPEEAELVEQAIAADPALQRTLDTYREVAHALTAALVPVAPPAEVRGRLFASLDEVCKPPRLDRFSKRMAELFDVSLEKARMFLGWVDEPSRWEEQANFPNVQLIHLPAGPAWAAADCGLVRMQPGFKFPLHDHKGQEVTLVLQGTGMDSTGTRMEPGVEMVLDPGHPHAYTVDDGSEPYVFAVRFYGIELIGPTGG